MELEQEVFGSIKAREILGADPDMDGTREMLEQETALLLRGLKGMAKEELEAAKGRQVEVEKQINSRPGAMALPQSKIRLFTEYSTRYIRCIQDEISART